VRIVSEARRIIGPEIKLMVDYNRSKRMAETALPFSANTKSLRG
jgi:L-alanine-DL-glutamate epimerase-like enolase superfamily enzyme